MKKYLVNNNSDSLLVFFTGWGCDEYEFEHLKSASDVLLLYDYTDMELDFDFSKYKQINLIAYSAGVFAASIFDYNFEAKKKIAISGNPYLFDEYFGLSKEMQDLLCGITLENADDFAKKYLVKTDEEWKKFHHSKRSVESCQAEFESLKKLYKSNKSKIKDIFDMALIGADDKMFDVFAQAEFYGERLHVIEKARHSMFFRIKNYEELFL